MMSVRGLFLSIAVIFGEFTMIAVRIGCEFFKEIKELY